MTVYHDPITQGFLPIPDAPCYVLAYDSWFDGWGPGKGKRNTLVVPCPDAATAQKVALYAKSRGDVQRVRIVRSKPRAKVHVLYTLCAGWVRIATTSTG